MARRSKLTAAVQKKIVASLRAGNWTKTAAQAGGITEACFYNWLARGENEAERVAADPRRRIKDIERPFVEFFESVTRAKGEAESNAVQAIAKAGKKDWRAFAWLLERRYSDRWANTHRVEVQVEKEFDAMLGLLEETLDPHEFRKVAGILAGVGERRT